MRRRTLLYCLLVVACSMVGQGGFALPQPPVAPVVRYTVTPRLDATPPRLDFVLQTPLPEEPQSVNLQLPVWTPGDYHIQNHAQYVRNLKAWEGTPDQARPLVVERPDANTWRVQTRGANSLTVAYSLPATPRGFFSQNVQIKESHIFINGPSAYLYLENGKTRPARLSVVLPKGWRAIMPLAEIKEEEGSLAFDAPDYDTLADSPLLLAQSDALKVEEFTLFGKPHRAVFYSRADRITRPQDFPPVLKRIIEAFGRIMGKPAYDRYVFFFDVYGEGGGLEHLNSTRIAMGDAPPERMAHLIAHEYFHNWNVKRIRPRVLGPFDYIIPPQTRNLWFAEGVTDYYATLGIRRAGLTSEQEFLEDSRWRISHYLSLPARKQVSPDESSLRVWEANNSSGFGTSYYLSGYLMGLCLDLKIRGVTQNRKSLDDVMTLLMKQHAPPKWGYEEDGVREAVNRVAGQDLSAFYDRLVRSTEEPPFSECLEFVGLDTNLQLLPNPTPEQRALYTAWSQVFPPPMKKNKTSF